MNKTIEELFLEKVNIIINKNDNIITKSLFNGGGFKYYISRRNLLKINFYLLPFDVKIIKKYKTRDFLSIIFKNKTFNINLNGKAHNRKILY